MLTIALRPARASAVSQGSGRLRAVGEVISQRVSALEALSKLPEAGKLEKNNQRIEELSRERDELLRQHEKMVHENEAYQDVWN